MNWKTTKLKPEIGKWIVMAVNTEDCSGIYSTIGLFMGENMDTLSWRVIPQGGDAEVIYNIGDIHAWEYEGWLAREGFDAGHKEPLRVYCPHCKEIHEVYAVPCHIEVLDVPLEIDTIHNMVVFNWDMVDNECDFRYVCYNCGSEVAKTTEELRVMSMNKNKVHSFLDDTEKMMDFYMLTKNEFLKSYSYLTEEEYDATVEDVKKVKGWK